MKRNFLHTTFFVIISSIVFNPLFAIDYKQEALPCIVSPSYSFTGYYLGANVGWKWGSYSTTFQTDNFSIDDVFIPTQSYQFDTSENSFAMGGQAGYSYQSRNFLFGLEGDWNSMSLGTSRTLVTTSSPVLESGDVFSTTSRWESSYRLRLGYVYRNLLLYGTTGVTRANFEVKVNLLSPDETSDSSTVDSNTKTQTGGTIGVGMEYALTRYWSVGLEYRYSKYAAKNFTLDDLVVSDSPYVQTEVTAKVQGYTTNQVLFKTNFRVYA